jgi:hypothetical protein
VRAIALSVGLCSLACAAQACTPTAADTVDLGDNFEAPELTLDDDFFYCQIQPNVLSAMSCAEGASGDGGGCHTERSALRLIPVDEPARCQGDRLVGAPPTDAEVNLNHVRASIGIDAESSPLYRRPLGLDSHPRQIFDAQSPEAMLLRRWLSGGM